MRPTKLRPLVLPAVDVLLQPEVIDPSQSANLLRCAVCGGWVCSVCAVYVAGSVGSVGPCAEYNAPATI